MANKSSQKIFNNSLLYSLGTIASKAVGFFLVPIYTNNMSSAEYGVATTVISFVSAAGIFITLSLRAALIRFYNEYDKQQQKRFVGSVFTFVSLNAVVICSLLILLRNLYSDIFFNDISFFPYVFWGVLALGTEGIYSIYQSVLQARQDGKAYSVNSIVYLFAHAVTVVVFVYVLKMEAEGMIIALFVSNLAFAVYGFLSMLCKKIMVVCFDKQMLKKAILYSLPILPHNLSNNANTYAIKTVIGYSLTYALSGLYSLASQFSTIINLVQSSINLAFRPWFIEQMGYGEEGRAQIKKMSCMIMALYSFCAVGIAAFSKEIVMIMSEETYFKAWEMVPFLVISQLISFIYYSHVQSLMYNLKWSKYTFVSSLSGLIVNVVAAIILVRYISYYGIVVAQILSKIVLSSIAVIMSNRAEGVDFGLKTMIKYLVFAALFSGVSMAVSFISGDSLSIVEIAIKLFIIGVAFLVYFIPYKTDFIELFLGLLKRKKGA